MGFIRTLLVGYFFGARGQADVVNLVFSVPNNMRKLLAEGAISAAFIPELSREVHEDSSGERARNLGRQILGLLCLIIIPIILLSLAFPRQVLAIFQGFEDPSQVEMAVSIFRWMIPYLFFVSIGAIMMAVLNTHFRFLVPALAPIIFSFCVISSLLFFARSLGPLAIAFGVFLGGIAQVGVQYPAFHRLGYSLKPSFHLRGQGFSRLLRRWIPMLFTSSLFYLNSWLALRLATILPEGSTSALTNAIVFYQLPFGLFSASITTVLYPRMSRDVAQGNQEALVESLGFGARNLWALLFPSALALIVLGAPIVTIALARGEFTPADARLAAQVLMAYSVGMPFVGLFNIAQRALYALGAVRKAFFCALVAVVVDMGFSLAAVYLWNWPVQALAWANSFAFALGALLEYLIIRQMTGQGFSQKTLKSLGTSSLATGLGMGLILVLQHFLGNRWWIDGSSWKGFAILMALCGAGALLILILYRWTGVEVVSIILKRRKSST